MNPKDLRQIRLSLKMTQANFGAELGLTGNTIARYERGESQPDNPKLFQLAVEQVRQQKIAAAFAPEWEALLERSKQLADELKDGVDPNQQRIRTPAEDEAKSRSEKTRTLTDAEKKRIRAQQQKRWLSK